MAIDVRSAHTSDLTALGATLGRAFYDDPVSVWMLPDEATRTAALSKFFAASTRHHHLAGGGVEIACDGSTIGAAALWDPPGRWKQSSWTSLLSLPTIALALGRHLRVGAEVGNTLDAAHPTEPHWYLATIGTSSAGRGDGHGTALLHSRLNRCDAAGLPAYLESSKEANIPYYERFGFAVSGEIVLPNGGPTLWQMWRRPRGTNQG